MDRATQKKESTSDLIVIHIGAVGREASDPCLPELIRSAQPTPQMH
jgi:hypothetical protein